ncbi:hypothetical protein GQ600_12478 [Phytophthora cactorum]|nr:hypothetical protein GQ600_12478 [Phytophthora cactorum]
MYTKSRFFTKLVERSGRSNCIHLSTSDCSGSSGVGLTIVDNTEALLISSMYDALCRISSSVGLMTPNMTSSSLPGIEPSQRTTGMFATSCPSFLEEFLSLLSRSECRRTLSLVLKSFQRSGKRFCTKRSFAIVSCCGSDSKKQSGLDTVWSSPHATIPPIRCTSVLSRWSKSVQARDYQRGSESACCQHVAGAKGHNTITVGRSLVLLHERLEVFELRWLYYCVKSALLDPAYVYRRLTHEQVVLSRWRHGERRCGAFPGLATQFDPAPQTLLTFYHKLVDCKRDTGIVANTLKGSLRVWLEITVVVNDAAHGHRFDPSRVDDFLTLQSRVEHRYRRTLGATVQSAVLSHSSLLRAVRAIATDYR